jgi:hypothetical protein
MIKQTKFGWVDLSNLPITNDKIDWKQSIGRTVRFQYGDICSTIFIRRFDDENHDKVIIDIENIVQCQKINYDQIRRGELGAVLRKRTKEYKYQIGDIVNGSMLITDRYKEGSFKYYNYICQRDGYKGHMAESSITRGSRCPCCAGKIVVVGVNDVATTHPEVAAVLLDENDARKYTAHSNVKCWFKCPHCGEKNYSWISNVTLRGLSCSKCGDNVSYPEKFIYNLLQQIIDLPFSPSQLVNFETHKLFDWSKNVFNLNKKISGKKIYDFYVPLDFPLIIEAHGGQHFIKSFETAGDARSLEEEVENDSIKEALALSNGILSSHYVVLDCRHSTMEHIKDSVMHSTLPDILHFAEDQIDWQECGRFAMSSLMLRACNLWNDGEHTVRQMANIMKMDKSTIYKYLRRGEELGIVPNPPKHINIKKKNTTK